MTNPSLLVQRLAVGLALAFMVPVTDLSAADQSTYVPFEGREINALSPEQIEQRGYHGAGHEAHQPGK